MGTIPPTYKNGDDWGMVYYCFTHMMGIYENIMGRNAGKPNARNMPKSFV